MPDADGGVTTPMPVFSFMGDAAQHPRQVPCWITHTNERTHEIIRSGFDRSPMFTGMIEGVGPRYCPSIEDKINRFADKDSHQIFLEPEGLTTHEFYPNGISTSLPFDIQLAAVRSIAGLENAAHPAAGLCDRVRLLRSARAAAELRDARDRRPVLRRPDQRHDRLRRGRGARPVRRHQCGAARATATRLGCRARPGLPGRPGRRPDHQGRDRAVPHVHQPRRVSGCSCARTTPTCG